VEAAARLRLPATPSKGSTSRASSSSSASTRATTTRSDVGMSADEATKSGGEEKLDGIKQKLVKLYQTKQRMNHTGLAVSQRRWSRVAESMGDMKLLWAKEKIKEFTFFQQLPSHVQSQLLDVVYYNKLSEGTPLFMQGDKPGIDDVGESYIVLNGEISIWVAPSAPSNKVVPQTSPKAAELPRRRMSRLSSSSSLLSEDEADRTESDKDSLDNDCEAETWGNLVASVHAGTLLGHLALMRQQPRNATCVAAMDTEVLVLRKVDFLRILKDYVEVMKDSKAEFLSNHIPGLTKLPAAKSEYLLHNFEKTTFERDFVFYEEGEPSTEKAVYVLAKGSIEVSSNGHTVGVLVPGAVFGSLESGTLQAFTLSVAHQSSAELYEVRGKDVLKLPHSLRQDIATHIQHSHMWHKLRLKEAPLAASPPPKVMNTPTGSQRGKNLPVPSEAPGLWAFAEQSRMKEAGWQGPVTLLQQAKGDSRPGSGACGPPRKLPARQAANLLTQQDFGQQGLKSSPSLPSLSRQGSSCSTTGTDSQRIGTSWSQSSRASSTASSRATKARAYEVLRRLKQMD